MSRIIRIIAITTIVAILSIPWVWLFTRDVFALALAFDAAIVIGVLFTRNTIEVNEKKAVETERKLNLPTTSPIRTLPAGQVDLSQTQIKYQPVEDCAKCGLVITPMMVRKEKGGLFYHLNCYPFPIQPSPTLGV